MGDTPGMDRLSQVIDALHAAAGRRAEVDHAALASVLAVLADEHPPDQDDEVGLGVLAGVFDLTPLDVSLLLIGCAPDLDPNIGAAFALLQDAPALRSATAALALELCGQPLRSGAARARLASGGPLRRHDLLLLRGDGLFLDRQLRVPDRVVAHLLGDDTPDPTVALLQVEIADVHIPEAAPLARALEVGSRLAWVRAGPGGLGLSTAASALAQLGVAHLAVDLRHCPEADLATTLQACAREAGLPAPRARRRRG